jgi:hypothetical protein
MMLTQSNRISLKTALLLTLLFLAVSALGMFNHELWLDEAQHFLIARDSSSLKELYFNMQYDGHVRLWNILLFFITHFISSNPVSMQVLHLLIINTTVFIFLRYAPFTLALKILIIFGYFFLYEYDVLSRNYTLGILMLFTCCSLLANEKNNLIWISLLFILMCNTHLFYVFASISIFLYVCYKRIKSKSFDQTFFIFTAIFAIAVTSVIIQIKIPPDNTYFHPEQIQWNSFNNILSGPYGFAKGLLPIPASKNGDYWNHFLFDSFPIAFKILISIFLFCFTISLFYKNRAVLLFYLSSVFFLMFFLYFSQMRASRYFGMFFIFFIAAAWLDGYERGNIFTHFMIGPSMKSKSFPSLILFLILLFHLYSGVYAMSNDIKRPFTEAKNVITYLTLTNELNPNVIVVDGYGGGPAISAYLGKKVFYADINQYGSYCVWKKSYFKVPPCPLSDEIFESGFLMAQTHFLLISVRTIANSIHCGNNTFQCHELKRFTRAIIRPDYYVYKVTRQNDE